MDKRYQVFVSSTFEDLQEERKEVIQALLEFDCIPAGMELFPASNDDQWSLIEKVIDNSDYYLLIVGGRYGSLNEKGISYTQMEFEYALETGKPIVSFLPKDPDGIIAKKIDKDEDGKKKLEVFKKMAQRKMVRYWTTPQDLGSIVSRSIIKLIKDFPAIGWVKANKLLDENSTQELLRLKNENEELKLQLLEATNKAPEGTEDLSQGEETYIIKYTYRKCESPDFTHPYEPMYNNQFETKWNEIFCSVSPLMMDEASDSELRKGMNAFTQENQSELLRKKEGYIGGYLNDFIISDFDFQTIKVQLRALGLITKSSRNRSIKDTQTYWTLTQYGDKVMTRLRAIKKLIYINQ